MEVEVIDNIVFVHARQKNFLIQKDPSGVHCFRKGRPAGQLFSPIMSPGDCSCRPVLAALLKCRYFKRQLV